MLLYIKAGVYGNEPRDVFNYARQSTSFPHETTADQFFSETQFESYRALGQFIAASIPGLTDMFSVAWREQFLTYFT